MTVKVLVVGHGPSYNNYEFIQNFDGKILSADISAVDLINHGIIPDYQLFVESQDGVVDVIDEFFPENFCIILDCGVRKTTPPL